MINRVILVGRLTKDVEVRKVVLKEMLEKWID